MAVSNTIALGAMMKRSNVLKKESLEAAIGEYFAEKPKVVPIKVKALELGFGLL